MFKNMENKQFLGCFFMALFDACNNLPQCNTVLTYDARNHGESGRTDYFGYDEMMEDVRNLMEMLGMPRAVLVGHGMGGKTAMDFALKYPEKVEQLVVEDMTLKFQPEGERAFCLKYMDLLDKAILDIPAHVTELAEAKAFTASYVNHRIPKEYRSEDAQEISAETMPLKMNEATRKFEWKLPLKLLQRAILNGFQSEPDMDGFRIFKYEGEFQGPALFICGEKSPYKVLNDQAFISDRMKNATFKSMAGGGHLLHLDQRDKFCSEVVHFINSN